MKQLCLTQPLNNNFWRIAKAVQTSGHRLDYSCLQILTDDLIRDDVDSPIESVKAVLDHSDTAEVGETTARVFKKFRFKGRPPINP